MHVCHVIYRFDVGGMENGIVNLINEMPADKARHTIISLTYKTDFAKRLKRNDVDVYEINKRPGNDLNAFFQLYKLLRKIKPDIVHSRNHPTTEIPFIAKLAGVRAVVHGEHGRDVHDIDGSNKKYRLLKRLVNPFVDHYICVSKDLSGWLENDIGIHGDKITQIYNGVDSIKFSPPEDKTEIRKKLGIKESSCIFGTVGRLEKIKGHIFLVEGFNKHLGKLSDHNTSCQLIIIGKGGEKDACQEIIESSGIQDVVSLPGAMDNVNEWLRCIDVFVLPSLGEGISNTILESMSTGLPVIATYVGGNPELVNDGETGVLVEPQNAESLASAMLKYAENTSLRAQHGTAARQEVDKKYSMEAMVKQYLHVYQSVLKER